MASYLKRWSLTTLRWSGLEKCLRYGSNSNWAGVGASGMLTRCTSYLDVGIGARLQWEWRHWCYAFVPAPGHTRHHMCVVYNRSLLDWRTRITPTLDYTGAPIGVTASHPRSRQSPT